MERTIVIITSVFLFTGISSLIHLHFRIKRLRKRIAEVDKRIERLSNHTNSPKPKMPQTIIREDGKDFSNPNLPRMKNPPGPPEKKGH